MLKKKKMVKREDGQTGPGQGWDREELQKAAWWVAECPRHCSVSPSPHPNSPHFNLSPHLKFHLELCLSRPLKTPETQWKSGTKIRNLLESHPEERCKGWILGTRKWVKLLSTHSRNEPVRSQRLDTQSGVRGILGILRSIRSNTDLYPSPDALTEAPSRSGKVRESQHQSPIFQVEKEGGRRKAGWVPSLRASTHMPLPACILYLNVFPFVTEDIGGAISKI